MTTYNTPWQAALEKAREYIAVAPKNRSPWFNAHQSTQFGENLWQTAKDYALSEQTNDRTKNIADNLTFLAETLHQCPNDYMVVVEAATDDFSPSKWKRGETLHELAEWACYPGMNFRVNLDNRKPAEPQLEPVYQARATGTDKWWDVPAQHVRNYQNATNYDTRILWRAE